VVKVFNVEQAAVREGTKSTAFPREELSTMAPNMQP
jgi:hypothetical protein